MTDSFDPYYVWLGIQPKDQPPNHYRLLGLEVFEHNDQVIDIAANRQTSYLHEMASGPNAKHSQRLLNEIAGARACLLDPDRKAKYDEKLRVQMAASQPEPARVDPVSTADDSETARVPQPELGSLEDAAPVDDGFGESPAAVIPLTCDACGSFYEVGVEDAGTLVECACGHVLTVPNLDGATSASAGSFADAGPEGATADPASSAAVAIATSPASARDKSDVEAKEPDATSKARLSAAEKTDEDKEDATVRKKKSGWGMTAVVGVGTVAMAVVLFKVLTADQSSEPEPSPAPPQTQSDTDSTGGSDTTPADDTDEPDADDGGGGGTFGPIRFDTPGK